jgi:hypothetical protein
MEKLFHYTSIGSLAQILKSKKFLFSRIDRSDDASEISIFNAHGNTFVSSWCAAEDNIGLWNIYGDQGKGIALGFDLYPFEFCRKLGNNTYGKKPNIVNMTKYQLESILIPDPFLTKIVYDTKKALEEKENIERKLIEDDVKIKNKPARYLNDSEIFIGMINHIKLLDDKSNVFGKYKEKVWSFQKEYRYRLIYDDDKTEIIPEKILIKIDRDYLANMKIIVGPYAGDKEKILLELLIKGAGFKPNNILVESKLKNIMRQKNI